MNATDQTPPSAEQISLANRFILTQVDRQTLVFPATWVAEILRIDRSQILNLPFYDSLLVGIANYNGVITPLIAAAHLLEIAQFTVPERVMVVRLSEAAGQLENVSIIIDRAIGSSSREELPTDLLTENSSGAMVMMRNQLVPASLWQPQYWSVNN